MRTTSLVCTLLLLCQTSTVMAQPAPSLRPIQDIPPGEDIITAVKKGDPAPYSGQLFDQSTAVRWGNWLEQYKFRWMSDVELEKRRGELGVALWQQKYTIQKDFYEEQLRVNLHDKAVLQDQVNNRPWYTSLWFGVVLGVVGTGLLAGGTAYTVKALK